MQIYHRCFVVDDQNNVYDTAVVELDDGPYDKPLVIGGFVGATLVGILSARYIIEHLNLHQVAHVRSHHIPPVAVFVGGKLRHPFRIYKDDKGKVIIMISEVPIEDKSLYEVSSALMNWLEKKDPAEIVILDGAPVQGMPSDRKTYCVTEEERLESLKSKGIEVAESALITGIGGSILNECLIRKVHGTSLLTYMSATFPDPGAVLSLVQTLNLLFDLKIETKVLEEEVTKLHQDMSAVMDQYKQIQEQKKSGKVPETMYG